MRNFIAWMVVLLSFAPSRALALTDARLAAERAKFETRRDAMLQRQVSKPYPADDRDNKHLHNWNRLDFALAAFFTNSEIDRANAAVMDVATTKPMVLKQGRTEPADKFHWEAPLICRIYELFHGKALGDNEAEAIRAAAWEWCKSNAQLSDADVSKVWDFRGSENIGSMRVCAAWGCTKILAASPSYAARQFNDGSTAAEQYPAWTKHVKEMLRQRVSRGISVETGSPTYSKYTLQCWYNYFDFADDAEMKKLAEAALTLWWADWAQDQIDGIRGGGKSRCYQGGPSQHGLEDGALSMAWYYLGVGRGNSQHPGIMCMATSAYRLPDVVLDLALDVYGRGEYEARSRRPGLLEGNSGTSPRDVEQRVNRVDADAGGIVRYSYATPDFIIGSNLLPRRKLHDWSAISAQNRWQGVIFAGDPDARIFPQCQGLRNGKTYNDQWAVQRKATLIVQKLDKPFSNQCGDMRVWFPSALKRSEEAGWIFAEARSAYAAVRPAAGSAKWDDNNWLRCGDPTSPVIIQVARRKEFADSAAFKSAVIALPMTVHDDVLTFKGLDDAGTFTFYLKSDKLPEIDGKPIDLSPGKTFQSPFIDEDSSSGVVTIHKDQRKLVLDVRENR